MKVVAITFLAGAAVLAALAGLLRTSAPDVHSSDEGHLRVADDWTFRVEPIHGSEVVTFSGLIPCVTSKTGPAVILTVRERETVGDAVISAAHVREFDPQPSTAGLGGHMIAAFGEPPTPTLEDTTFGGTYVTVGREEAVIDEPCGDALTRKAGSAKDIAVTIRVSDPERGGGVNGILIDYAVGSRRHSVEADVEWVVCGSRSEEVCPTPSD